MLQCEVLIKTAAVFTQTNHTESRQQSSVKFWIFYCGVYASNCLSVACFLKAYEQATFAGIFVKSVALDVFLGQNTAIVEIKLPPLVKKLTINNWTSPNQS